MIRLCLLRGCMIEGSIKFVCVAKKSKSLDPLRAKKNIKNNEKDRTDCAVSVTFYNWQLSERQER